MTVLTVAGEGTSTTATATTLSRCRRGFMIVGSSSRGCPRSSSRSRRGTPRAGGSRRSVIVRMLRMVVGYVLRSRMLQSGTKLTFWCSFNTGTLLLVVDVEDQVGVVQGVDVEVDVEVDVVVVSWAL